VLPWLCHVTLSPFWKLWCSMEVRIPAGTPVSVNKR